MEERHSPRDDGAPPTGEPDPSTIVVQIPRDNVCRVPPPDHDSIVREHSRTSSIPKRRRYHVPPAIPIVLIAAVIAGMAILAVRSTLYRPTPPQFSVTRIQKSNDTFLSPDIKVGVRAENKSPRMTMSYSGGGSAALLFDGKEIMQGKIPEPVNDEKDGEADFAVALAVKWAALSKAIMKKLNEDDDKEKLVELVLELPMQIKSLLRNERMNMKIDCEVWVRNALMKKPEISFQDCQTVFLKKT